MVDEGSARALLPRTWHAFFGRFGRLTEIQRLAVGPVAAGRPVLAVAPTATGKTEALVAPLCERALAGATRGLRILVICPTRALVNDLHRRLERPLRDVRLEAAIKSGDHPEVDEEAPPGLLITTPESLDSLLSRRPRFLRSVQSVVVDEVHLLNRTVRGDQLRCLLTRLDHVASAPPQRCAASATVADADKLAEDFLGDGAEVVVATAAVRSVKAELAPAPTLAEVAAHVAAVFTEAPGRKVLVFANARSQVEELTALLAAHPRFAGRVVAHHGSLARAERLRVEALLQSAPSAVCVATMTLEVGIDVGSVDRVVLIAPPPDVASLLQRIGRSNRRESTIHLLGLYTGEVERRRFVHLLACAAEGRLLEDPVAFRPTVLAQQALSLLLQSPKRWVSAEALRSRLPTDVAREVGISGCERVLAALLAREYVRRSTSGTFVAGERVEPLFEYGRIHSLIEDVAQTEVVDETTGRSLGWVRFSAAERATGGAGLSLSLGGRRRDVSRLKDGKLVAKSQGGAAGARFVGREPPRTSSALARDFKAFVGVPADEMTLAEVSDRHFVLWHFLGTVGGWLFDRLLESAQLKKGNRSGGALSTTLDRRPVGVGLGLGDLREVTARLDGLLTLHAEPLAKLLGVGAFLDAVPGDLLVRFVRESIDVDALARRVVDTRLREETDDGGDRAQ